MVRKINPWVIVSGIAIGASAVVLSLLGNPGNMGFCIACFLRDIAGAMGFHGAAPVQYFRPEIVGIVLGAMIMSLFAKEFKAKGGSAPMTRFILGAFVMIGALMFLGCPLRMVIRLGGGDLNALAAFAGFLAGILLGVVCLKKGFSLKRAYHQTKTEGWILPVVLTLLLVLSIVFPAMFKWSTEGPGSKAAPWFAALLIGGITGALCQRSRLCMAGGIRDAVMFKDFNLITGFAAILVTVILGNLFLGNFKPGFGDQPIAHTDQLWNFLGMVLVGWGSVLLGGCPLRQLILTGEGNSDAATAVLGMIFGAAVCHNFGLASSADGPAFRGQIAVIFGLAAVALIAVTNLARKEN